MRMPGREQESPRAIECIISQRPTGKTAIAAIIHWYFNVQDIDDNNRYFSHEIYFVHLQFIEKVTFTLGIFTPYIFTHPVSRFI